MDGLDGWDGLDGLDGSCDQTPSGQSCPLICLDLCWGTFSVIALLRATCKRKSRIHVVYL